jgi:hypothetical protein
LFCVGSFCAGRRIQNFASVAGDKIVDENGEIKFISFNIPCLHYNEDNMAFEQTNPWRLSDEFEINDALEAVRQMGGQVIRTYTLAVRRKGDDANIPCHITAPGEFNEEAFKTLDMVLAVANKKASVLFSRLSTTGNGGEAFLRWRIPQQKHRRFLDRQAVIRGLQNHRKLFSRTNQYYHGR